MRRLEEEEKDWLGGSDGLGQAKYLTNLTDSAALLKLQQLLDEVTVLSLLTLHLPLPLLHTQVSESSLIEWWLCGVFVEDGSEQVLVDKVLGG